MFKSRLQVSILDGSNWLIEGLGGNCLLSITPAVNIFEIFNPNVTKKETFSFHIHTFLC